MRQFGYDWMEFVCSIMWYEEKEWQRRIHSRFELPVFFERKKKIKSILTSSAVYNGTFPLKHYTTLQVG